MAAAIGAAVTGCSSSSSTDSAASQSSQMPAAASTTMKTRPGSATRTAPAAGTCPLSSLPPQAADTVRLIHSGGPFPHPRNDGVVFQNRERRLPRQASGYYHEYTVDTPGASTRGTRRVITGGTPLKSPPVYYYTGDHYATFCTITGAD
jgi:guanyl-specific ribonuclease Sa